jgi:hypothetical protein
MRCGFCADGRSGENVFEGIDHQQHVPAGEKRREARQGGSGNRADAKALADGFRNERGVGHRGQ